MLYHPPSQGREGEREREREGGREGRGGSREGECEGECEGKDSGKEGEGGEKEHAHNVCVYCRMCRCTVDV